MDASLESFIKYRVDRLRDISLEMFGDAWTNLVPRVCRLISDFCMNRPDSDFFKTARGTKLIRKDLKYFFPAACGLDIRPFTTGSRLKFQKKKFISQKGDYENCGGLLRAVSRLMIMVLTYDLFMVDINDILDINTELGEKAGRLQDDVFKLFSEYLVDILDVPPHAQVLHLSLGNIQRKVKGKLSRKNHELILGWMEAGLIPLDPEKPDLLFEEVCSQRSPDLPMENLALDAGEKVVVNIKKLQKHPVDDETLLKMLRYRYDITSYLFMANYFQQAKEKRELLFEKVTESLENLKSMSEKDRSNLADFLIGDQSKRLHRRAGFYFDPLPEESGIDWQPQERRSVFLGEKPDDPKISPQRIELPKTLVKSAKRPVCIMLDVSKSMSDCLDIAIKSLGILFGKLRNHPVNIVLFSSTAGVLNKGVPHISRGLPMGKEVPWLPKIVASIRKGLFLGGETSIGNGILMGKAVALGMAVKMKRYESWMGKNGIAAHCILISDNLHNTPRDISEMDVGGNYLVEGTENVIDHAARAGCSIHNLICCPPSSNIDNIIYRMHVMKYIEVISKNYFSQGESGGSRAKAIEKDLVMTVLQNKPKTLLYQYRDQDKFALVNTWIKSSSLDQLMNSIAGFVVYLRKKMAESTEIHDAVEFVGRKFRVGPEDFMESTINMDKVFRIYDLMIQDKEVVLENLDTSVFDASPMQIFKISHCIAETQRRIFPFSTTPVVTNMVEALQRRKDFDNELYFGLNNLEQLDIFANIIARQIDAME
ncbi:MAG: VWA domain-containing protein [Proteobacteria bacterium]|nr:VWA domain-containing protein [Pseudomonadota bacterium]